MTDEAVFWRIIRASYTEQERRRLYRLSAASCVGEPVAERVRRWTG